MMKPTIPYIKSCLWLFAALLMAACAADSDDISNDYGEMTTVELSIASDNSLLSRYTDEPTEYDEYFGAGEGTEFDKYEDNEFINTLFAVIVDNGGNVKWKSHASLAAEGAAGGVKSHLYPDELQLATGNYTVYAFANWQYDKDGTKANYSDKWTTLIAQLADGSKTTLTNDDLNGIILDNPAAKVDPANGSYIPMMGRTEVEVTATTRVITASIDRLVGKVVMVLTNENKASDPLVIKNLRFGMTSDKVALLSSTAASSGATRADENGYEHNPAPESEAKHIEIASRSDNNPNSQSEILTFYINETVAGTEHFSIMVDTEENITYHAQTAATTLKRNNVLLLRLRFKRDEVVEFTAVAYALPIDETEQAYTETTTNGKIYEGKRNEIFVADVTSKLEIKLKTLDGYTFVSPGGVTWTYNNSVINTAEYTADQYFSKMSATSDGKIEILTIDNFRALPVDFTIPLQLKIQWKDDKNTELIHMRDYNITIKVKDSTPYI